ncbi:MAG: hypothetical protein EOS65_03260 [Mesorhizobium sp.]|uniref:hypothetical protein n=1 Tax=Mesorhizobium sp. TaxID=1871066 RepID=UPI000FD2CF1C|nr:hypothetical protein [Mesorhizobium sp.]RVC58527.1 hypothetical protein EN779_18780 [Mesorhizobium sp. M4B.F.Ca.ET.088.02.2.1]RWF28681.1 MAG: hypothetical protein EOS45_21325 [Mesorhizobium sp.]RWF44158.1 MAG: hypothetical protein EOS65_03260 [Mesorhizobium sp.]TJW03541.1 MAG: hypothetical protein E5W97_18605 [Mesorhizobium sp.]
MTMKFPFLKAGTGMSVDCLDMPPERGPERGPEHGAMYWDLIKVIFCHECAPPAVTIGTSSLQTLLSRRKSGGAASAIRSGPLSQKRTKANFSGSPSLEEPMCPAIDNGKERNAQLKLLAERLARETGIRQEEAKRLIDLIGADWNSLLREARFLKGRH